MNDVQTSPAAPAAPTGIDATTLRRLAGWLPAGLTVVATRTDAGELRGATIATVALCPAAPPRYLVCLPVRPRTRAALAPGRPLAVSFLARGQADLAARFGSRAERPFAGVAWRPGRGGCPLLDGAAATLEGQVDTVLETGDHALLLVAPATVQLRGAEPLLHYHGRCVDDPAFHLPRAPGAGAETDHEHS